jgi:hypothetical protein
MHVFEWEHLGFTSMNATCVCAEQVPKHNCIIEAATQTIGERASSTLLSVHVRAHANCRPCAAPELSTLPSTTDMHRVVKQRSLRREQDIPWDEVHHW